MNSEEPKPDIEHVVDEELLARKAVEALGHERGEDLKRIVGLEWDDDCCERDCAE